MASSSNPVAPAPEPAPESKPNPTIADHVRGLVKSGEAFIRGAFRGNSGHPAPQQQQQQHHPADIMKRLQLETFNDIMKLGEKHDHIEGIVSLYQKHSKGFPFHGLSTRVKAALDIVGALYFVNDDKFDQAKESIDKTGNRTGLSSRIVFESKARHKDTMAVELASRSNGRAHLGEAAGKPLELTRLQYNASINDWLSMILIPLGAQCNNFFSDLSLLQDHRSRSSFSGPPAFAQYHNCAAGLSIKVCDFTASFAELLSGTGEHHGEHGETCRMTTFGQVTYAPFEDVKLSVSGLWQNSLTSSRFKNLGTLAVPIGNIKAQDNNKKIPLFVPPVVTMMLDGEFLSTKLEGWVQLERPSSGLLHWGLSLSDSPEHELGWGLRTGRNSEGNIHQLHMEGFLNFNLGNGGKLQPGLVYVFEGENQTRKRTPALVFRSSWYM